MEGSAEGVSLPLGSRTQQLAHSAAPVGLLWRKSRVKVGMGWPTFALNPGPWAGY